MQKEIETRFLEVDKKALVKKLLKLGGVDKGEEKIDEVIFVAADGSWLGKRKFVRLRKVGERVELTYKTNVAQQIDSAREIEFGVADFDRCSEFLQQVGLSRNRENEKLRHTLQLGEVTIDIDTWPKIPPYAEFEGPSVEALQDVCEKLGLDWEKRFDRDAAEIYKHYGHDIFKLTKVTFTEFE